MSFKFILLLSEVPGVAQGVEENNVIKIISICWDICLILAHYLRMFFSNALLPFAHNLFTEKQLSLLINFLLLEILSLTLYTSSEHCIPLYTVSFYASTLSHSANTLSLYHYLSCCTLNSLCFLSLHTLSAYFLSYSVQFFSTHTVFYYSITLHTN